jgi:hypothetical protein
MIGVPYVLTLVFLDHDPPRWFSEPREYAPGPGDLQAELVCTRYGRFHFIYDPTNASRVLEQMSQDNQRQRVVMILRPWEKLVPYPPVAEVRRGDLVWLYIYEFEI